MRPQLLRAVELIMAKEAEHRVFMLENPGLPGSGYITNSLGEIAPARHLPNALRFISGKPFASIWSAVKKVLRHRVR
jgi:gentisate 1,2-dioxygenase